MLEKELSDSEKKSIIQAVQNGIREDVRDFKIENQLSSYNCIHSIKWDFINTNLDLKLQSKRLKCKIVNRNIWELPTLYENITGTLYCITRKKNFFKIQNERNKREKPHYLDAFATYNKNVESAKHQIELFNTDKEFEEEKIDKVLDLLCEYKDKVNRFAIIVFEEENREIVTFETYLVDRYLHISSVDDWSHLITPKFDIEYTTIDKKDNLEIKIKSNYNLPINTKKKEKEEKDE